MAGMNAVKRVKNAVLFDNGTIRIDMCRGSYVHLDKPYKGKSDDGDGSNAVAKYSIVGLMPKETHAEAKALIEQVIEKMKKDNKNIKIAKDKLFIRDGDDQDKEEYEGMWTVSAREERKPACRDKNGDLVTDVAEIREMFKSGYWFSILIRPWLQDNKYGKRINAGLVGVMFQKKDETFGDGGIDDTDAWGGVKSEDGDGFDENDI